MSRGAILFDNFGPYHWARLRAATHVCDLMAIQIGGRSAEYAWENEASADGFKFTTLFQQGTSRNVQQRELVRKMDQALDDFRPQVVFIPGWSSQAAFAAFRWCIRHNVPAVAMSESTKWDGHRVWWKEWVKRKLVGLCATALAGGSPHKDYMVKLGMPRERIFLGYDAVDNRYFADKAEEIRNQKLEIRNRYGLPERYFLASARLIEKKNLPRLIEAYARYRALAEKSEVGNRESEIWDLVLLGDGPLRETINSQLSTLNLDDHVQLPGFKQYHGLPTYYGLAGAFVHASTTEQWGLVVNEAMASGLPVLVSNRCGCAPDLVQDGVNGFTFDPYDVDALAQLMLKISAFNFPLPAFADASQRIISEWGPDRFANGLKQAVECALRVGPVKPSLLQRMILKALIAC